MSRWEVIAALGTAASMPGGRAYAWVGEVPLKQRLSLGPGRRCGRRMVGDLLLGPARRSKTTSVPGAVQFTGELPAEAAQRRWRRTR